MTDEMSDRATSGRATVVIVNGNGWGCDQPLESGSQIRFRWGSRGLLVEVGQSGCLIIRSETTRLRIAKLTGDTAVVESLPDREVL